MSNEIPPREIVDQAGSSSGNNPTETEEDDQAMPNILTSQTRDFSKMSREDVTKYVDESTSYAEAQSLDNQKGVDILLAWEKGGFAPRKREKHFLKAKFPNIPFKTPEWQTWVSGRCIDFLNCS